MQNHTIWYNLSMGSARDKDYLAQAYVYFGEGIELSLAGVDEKTRRKLGRAWNNPVARVGDNSATYRFVNYLDSLGLLPDHREKGEGWRKFSYVDTIYLELVMALRKVGVKSKTIKLIYDIFSQPYKDENVIYRGILWLDILIAVHSGVEIELLISPNGNSPLFCDPAIAFFFGTRPTEGQIRISLSSIINKVRDEMQLAPIKITYSLASGGLYKSELEAVFAIRNLKNETEEVKIHKTTKGKVLVDVKRNNENEELRKDLEKVFSKHNVKDFTNISLAIRQGGVAYVKETDSNIFSK